MKSIHCTQSTRKAQGIHSLYIKYKKTRGKRRNISLLWMIIYFDTSFSHILHWLLAHKIPISRQRNGLFHVLVLDTRVTAWVLPTVGQRQSLTLSVLFFRYSIRRRARYQTPTGAWVSETGLTISGSDVDQPVHHATLRPHYLFLTFSIVPCYLPQLNFMSYSRPSITFYYPLGPARTFFLPLNYVLEKISVRRVWVKSTTSLLYAWHSTNRQH